MPQKLPMLTTDQLKDLLCDHSVSALAKQYGVSRQRMYQVVERHGLARHATRQRLEREWKVGRERYREWQVRKAARHTERKRYIPGLVPPPGTETAGDVAIVLSNGAVCWVSGLDADLVHVKWQAVNGYATTRNAPGSITYWLSMHRLILSRMTGAQLPAGIEPDHIDGDRLNNRRSNLRPATRSLNQANRKRPRNNTSGYKGVSFNQGKWQATISKDGRYHCLGRFDSAEDAARAYDKAAIEMFGSFARTNGEL